MLDCEYVQPVYPPPLVLIRLAYQPRSSLSRSLSPTLSISLSLSLSLYSLLLPSHFVLLLFSLTPGNSNQPGLFAWALFPTSALITYPSVLSSSDRLNVHFYTF